MAQITLNIKSTSESFSINDAQIVYVTPYYINGVVSGSNITIIDTASADTLVRIVEETPSAVAALTSAIVQITLTSRETPYIAISRIKDIITVGSVANITYDGSGNVTQTLNTSMTTNQILTAIQTNENEAGSLASTLLKGNTTGNSNIEVSTGATIVGTAELSLLATENVIIAAATGIELHTNDMTSKITLGINGANRIAVALDTYADNAAAITGGLEAGDLYILTATNAVTVVV